MALFTTKLHEYQKKALLWMLERETSPDAPGGFLTLDMGLGKTVLTIAVVCMHPLDHTLVIVPKNIVPQWVAEFKKFSGITPMVITASESNSGKVTAEEMRKHRVVITPISTFGSMKEGGNALFDFDFDRIVVDEAHLLRNDKTKSYKLVKKLKSHVKWCLSGTPINRNQNDFKTLLEFMSIFQVTLTYAAKKYMYRVVKEDVEEVNIPDLTIEDIRADFKSEDERYIYTELLEEGKTLAKAYSAYGSGEGRMRILEQLLRLRQTVTNAEMLPEGVTQTIFSGRSTKLHMLCDSIQSSPIEKTIIFVHWNKEIDSICQMLTELGQESAVISGRVSMQDRVDAIKRFNSDPTLMFFIIQIEAGGVGLNLQAASRVYINSLAWNASSELQAIARSHRIGQKNKVTVKRLVINDTIDDHIIGVQQKKLAVAAEILNDPRIHKSLSSSKGTKGTFQSMMGVFK